MTGSQRQRDYDQLRTEERGGKKKQPIGHPTSTPREEDKTVLEHVQEFAEADREAEQAAADFIHEQEDLDGEEYDDEFEDVDSMESAEGEEAHDGSTDGQGVTEEEGLGADEQSSESEGEAGAETSSTDGAQDESDEEFVERAVDTANEFEDRKDTTRLEYAMWGFKTFFDGKVEAALAKKHGQKSKYAKFLANERLKTDPRRVSDLIRGAAIRTNLIDQNLDVSHLTFSHCLELAAVDDEATRIRLAKEIHQKQLSVRKTRERVQEINSKKVAPKLVEKLLAKIKDPRSLPVSTDYAKMDEEFLENELSKKERLTLRAEMDTKRDQLKACNAFLDLLEKRLSDIDL